MHWPAPVAVPPELEDGDAPDWLLCPITQCLMTEPAIVTSSGRTYERSAVSRWVTEVGTDPLDPDARLTLDMLAPNLAVRQMLERFVAERIERAAEITGSRRTAGASGEEGGGTPAGGVSDEWTERTPFASAPAASRLAASASGPASTGAVVVRTTTRHVGDDDPLPGGTLRVIRACRPSECLRGTSASSSGAEEADGGFFAFSVARLEALLRTDAGGWDSRGIAGTGVNVKAGGGAVLRARNERTGKSGALLLFSLGPIGGAGVVDGRTAEGLGFGCWNPSDYAAAGDFEAGDVIVLLDFASEPPAARGEVLPVASYAARTKTGWNLPGRCVRFGWCGLVGDWWKALEVEFALEGRGLVLAVRTDSPDDLPLEVWCEDEAGVFVRAAAARGSQYGAWELDPPVSTGRVRVRWEDTDLHKCGGLSSARSGGGLHAEIVGVRDGHDDAVERAASETARASIEDGEGDGKVREKVRGKGGLPMV